jgi:dTDP-4-dehydrorhamnose 3,5-epimerase-like enzyme
MKKNIPEIIALPKIVDYRGNLSFIEGYRHVPFSIKRVYWIYDVPGGEIRGGHAFREQIEFIVALSGSFDVVVQQGKVKKHFVLNRSYFGLLVPSGVWRSMENFSTNSVALVLASTHFDESDYVRSLEEFKSLPKKSFDPALIPAIAPVSVTPNNNYQSSIIEECSIITLEKNHKEKGNITVIEKKHQIPFGIARVYYLYDIPGGEERGGHAHKELSQLIIAVSGSFDVVLNDGKNTKIVTLNRPYQGLYIVPGIWRELVNFSSGSCCLVLASHQYSESDYIRNSSQFQKVKTIVDEPSFS